MQDVFTSDKKVYALFAGNGDLPIAVITSLLEQRYICHVICFKGVTEEETARRIADLGVQVLWYNIGHVGAILSALKQHKVTHITMAGAMRRPQLSDLSLDWTGTKWMARLGKAAFAGDDGLLSKLVDMMGCEGFEVVAPHSIVDHLLCEKTFANEETKAVQAMSAPRSTAKDTQNDITESSVEKGIALTHARPLAQHMADITLGQNILNALSPFDVGQSVVVRDGVVLGIEALEGTASLLMRAATLQNNTSTGGVLVKRAKTGQSLVVDVPTIGPDTVTQAYNARLQGIALSRGTCQILNRDRVLEMCHRYDIFLYMH